MKRFNVVIPQKYTKNGEEKTYWNRVGKLVRFEATEDRPEGYILELFMFPNTTFKVFEEKKQEDSQQPSRIEDLEDDSQISL